MIEPATLKSKIDAIMTSAVPEVHDKPWYSNNATTTKRLRDNAELCSHLLGSIMILDPAWVSIAESHNAEVLDGAEEPLMTTAIMSTYFLDCAKVRDAAFELVCAIWGLFIFCITFCRLHQPTRKCVDKWGRRNGKGSTTTHRWSKVKLRRWLMWTPAPKVMNRRKLLRCLFSNQLTCASSLIQQKRKAKSLDKIKSKLTSKAKGLEEVEEVSPKRGRKGKGRSDDDNDEDDGDVVDGDEDEGCGGTIEHEDSEGENDEEYEEEGGRGEGSGRTGQYQSEGEDDGEGNAAGREDEFKTEVAATRANQCLVILEESLDGFITKILKAWQSCHRRSSDEHLRQTTTKMFVDGCRQVYVSGQLSMKTTFVEKLTRALSTLLAAYVKERGTDDAQSIGIQRWVGALEGELVSFR